MSHVDTQHGRDTRAAGRIISPLAVVLVGMIVWTAYRSYVVDEVTIAGDGWAIYFGAAAVWIVYGAIVIAAIVALQRYARRPAWTIALALAWGAFPATYFAAFANDAMNTIFLSKLGSGDSIWVSTPVVEETVKMVGVIALVLVPVLRRIGPVDGLFYGVLVGIGFQVYENFIYSLNVAFESLNDAPWQAIWINVFLRGVIVPFTHLVWTGIVGAAIGAVVAAPRSHKVRAVLLTVAAMAVVVPLHGADDWAATNRVVWATFVDQIIGLVIFVAVVLWAQRAERRRLTDLAAADDGWGVVDVADLRSDEPDRAARKRHRRQLRYAYARDQFGPDARLTERSRPSGV